MLKVAAETFDREGGPDWMMLEVCTKVRGKEEGEKPDIPMNWFMPLEWSYPGIWLEDVRARGGKILQNRAGYDT